jgi:hypothetical protein
LEAKAEPQQYAIGCLQHPQTQADWRVIRTHQMSVDLRKHPARAAPAQDFSAKVIAVAVSTRASKAVKD